MKKANSMKAVFLTALLTVLVSCAGSQGMKIGNTVTLCCPGDYATYKSYGIDLTQRSRKKASPATTSVAN